MARTETKIVNGIEVTLQSVSPQWYLDNYDRFGRGKNTSKYIDELIRNVVVAPAEIASGGIAYFNEREDVATATMLMDEIETFLCRPGKQGDGKKPGAAPA